MDVTEGRARAAWRAALAVVAVATVAPLWLVPLPPFSDLPEQVAAVATIRHWWDASWQVPADYTFSFGKSQYVLYHALTALVAVPCGSAEVANKLMLTLAGLALAPALASLARALDRDERLAVFAPPVFWSRPLLMGFAPYVASIPVVVWGIAVAARQARAPSRRRAIGLGALALATFYLHADAYVLLAAGAVAFEIAFHLPVRRGWVAARVRALAWLAPSAVVAGAWSIYGAMRPSLEAPGGVVYKPLAELVREFPSWSHDVWQSHVDEACAIVVWAAFAALVVQRGDAGQRGRARTLLAAVPFACACLVYLALPYGVGFGVMLNVRIAVFVTLFAPLLVETTRGWRSSVPLAAVTIAGLVLAADSAYEMRRVEDEEAASLDQLLDRIPPRARVLTLPFHLTSPRVHWAPWLFAGAYHRARSGGVASYSFSDLAHWPIHFKEGREPPGHGVFWTFDACSFRNETDGAYYDYVLARGDVDPFRDAPPGPRWRKVDTTREFVLWEKIAGATNPRWTIDDAGPCESRASLERRAQGAVALPIDPR